jgi:adenylate cyclase
MANDIQLLNQIVRHRLEQGDIERILTQISARDRNELLAKIGDLLRRMSALMDVYNKISDTLSLDTVLARLMEIISDAMVADRSTLFLYDREHQQLFSRIAQGASIQEIRFPANAGIAGAVFTSGEAIVIDDAYSDPRFNQDVDRKTGYRTRNILCVPLKNKNDEIIGVSQVLNKSTGNFTEDDCTLLEAITTQAAAALENARLHERIERARREEARLMEVTNALSSELHLDALLSKIMSITSEMLEADRSTLFMHDPKTDELWSVVTQGGDVNEIRFPAGAGIAGSVFRSRSTVNIPDAYSDDRFNPEVDRRTGYKTRNILCMPIVNKSGRAIGVTQVLNKRDGPFTEQDERRLAGLTSQAAIALENAKLFEEVLNERNYSESILRSLNTGVMTLDADSRIIKANSSALRILRRDQYQLLDVSARQLFENGNGWILDSIAKVESSGQLDFTADTDLSVAPDHHASVNLTVVPLMNTKEERLGCMLIFDDISSEKRVRSTMARYMTKEVAERLLEDENSMLGGQAQEVSILFSDIRRFTTISESLGARDTVPMLNDYFSVMVEVVFHHRGILDKYIGDAIMALFGTPFQTPNDADNAVASAIDMMVNLQQFNRERIQKGFEPIEIGIGVNTGEVIAGNIGSSKRMDYTVIGDGVNLAARLESANKFYGSRVLVSGHTFGQLKDPPLAREVDLLRVKGKNQPVPVYEVLEFYEDHELPHRDQIIACFKEGLEAYRERDWRAANRSFSGALELHPSDRPSQLYVERCNHYSQQPPPDDWDGVWIMETK